MKRVKAVRSVAIVVRLLPAELDAMRLNAGVHGLSMSDYIRQKCLGIHLRRTPEEKRRLHELAKIGVNLNQLAKWANTYKRTVEAFEILQALRNLESQIAGFASATQTDDENEAGAC